MKQIVVIHGGDTFDNRKDYQAHLKSLKPTKDYFKANFDWKYSLGKELGDDYEIFNPRMPNSNDAEYLEWETWFEKLISLLEDEIILVGHSLGGSFLVKYLATNKIDFKPLATILVSPPYDGIFSNEPTYSFTAPPGLGSLEKQAGQLYLIHSEDDPVVSFEEHKLYKDNLKNAIAVTFTDRQHFNQIDFPELIQLIQKVGKKG
jgi:predicted alpha/beta hydrolase family esterase